MLFGRFFMIIPMMGIAGSLAAKKQRLLGRHLPGSYASVRRLARSVILIVGALTFFPVLSLGPIVEHFLMKAGYDFLSFIEICPLQGLGLRKEAKLI